MRNAHKTLSTVAGNKEIMTVIILDIETEDTIECDGDQLGPSLVLAVRTLAQRGWLAQGHVFHRVCLGIGTSGRVLAMLCSHWDSIRAAHSSL